MYDRLFKPLTIGLREARNRVLFGSHATNLARHNLLSSQHADYYAARAEGGAGIIVLEEHIVHVSDMPYESAVLGYLPNTVQAVAAVAKRIHIHGSLAFVQLNHNGQQSTSGHHQREMWAPSPVPDVSSRETPKEMEQADIRAVVEGFPQVAHNVTQAEADGVEMIRALIADPNLPRLSQEGHAERVRPCISCNQGCQVRGMMNATISCSVNPDVIHAQVLLPEKSQVKSGQKVYIVGGGPAGLEAARTAVLRAREVVLYEREAVLGGTVALAAKGPGRGELQLITDYLVSELERLGIEVHTGVEVTVEMLRCAQHDKFPHTVIIATGAYTGSGLLPIQGHDLPHVTDIRRVLAGEPVEGQRVVVIDETDSHGVLSVVELLASMGKNVEVVTEDFYAGRDLVATHDLVLWKQRVLPHGIVVTLHTAVARIEPGKVIVVDRFAKGERELPADIVVLGTYERPSQELYMALKDRIPHLFRIGDCVAPRRIEQAILEGRRVGEQV